MVRAVAPKNINLATGPLTLVGIWSTQEVVALSGDLPVGGVSGEQTRTLARMVIPVDVGDYLSISGRQRVTNDIGPVEYTVGAGYWCEVYDVDDGLTTASPERVWLRVGSFNGDNVTPSPDRHHMPIHLEDVWKVPANWPAGHRAVVCFRVDAHSTGWKKNSPTGGDKLTVDDYGVLTVHRYRPFVEDPRWALLADLQARVAALESATPPECP